MGAYTTISPERLILALRESDLLKDILGDRPVTGLCFTMDGGTDYLLPLRHIKDVQVHLGLPDNLEQIIDHYEAVATEEMDKMIFGDPEEEE